MQVPESQKGNPQEKAGGVPAGESPWGGGIRTNGRVPAPRPP